MRATGDINAMWGTIVSSIANLAGRGHMAGPGGWNYPDSLEVGNARRGRHLTPAETRAHFALYCVTSSPLILGNDVRNMSADDLSVVSNARAIAVNQGASRCAPWLETTAPHFSSAMVDTTPPHFSSCPAFSSARRCSVPQASFATQLWMHM